MNRRRPLAVLLLLSATAVATLAVPAGAATTKPKTTWVHQTVHCAGRKSATVTFKMQGGRAVDSWVDNTCGRQYVTVTWCDALVNYNACGATDFGPKTKGHLGPLNYGPAASLGWGPTCPDGTGTGPGTDCQV